MTQRPPSVIEQRNRARRRAPLARDPNSVVASAALMTGRNPSSAPIETDEWQKRCWHYYRTIGELRFGINWLANALSRVNLVAAIPPQRQGDEPTPIDVTQDGMAGMQPYVDLVAEIAGGVTGQGQMLAQCAIQLSVPGLGYILATADDQTDSFSEWRVLSNEEVQRATSSRAPRTPTTDAPVSTATLSPLPDPGIEVRDAQTGEWVKLKPTDVLVKVWQSDARESWKPDSAVRSVMPTLAEIELITKRIAAESYSRLIGAGLLLMPEEAEFPPGQPQTGGEIDPNAPDEFVATFHRVAQLAIADQESPAAKVPLMARMPGELIKYVAHLKFWSEFDAQMMPLREAAIKRLALGLDIPPDVLLGLGDANHWSAWQIAEEAITLHVEPKAETVCHALTVSWFRAACLASGLDPTKAIVWYDTTDLTTRPDRSAAAGEAHGRIILSDAAYLAELGLDGLPPEAPEYRKRVLIDAAKGAPTLAPAMLKLAGVISEEDAIWATQLAAGTLATPGGDGSAPPPPPPGDQPQPPDRPVPEPPPPDQQPDDGTAPAPAPATAVLAAAELLVDRALERAGLRLRNRAGAGRAGGNQAVECDDPRLLHTQIRATDYMSLDALLDGAWDRVPQVAERFRMDAASLTACLDGYTRGLIAVGHAHEWDRLALAMGADGADRLAAAH